MKLVSLLEAVKDAITRYGDIDVEIEIWDHGSFESLIPTTFMIKHDMLKPAVESFIISTTIRD